MSKGGKLTELTIGGELIPMRLLMKFKYKGNKYTAFTPKYGADSSDEEEVALARVISSKRQKSNLTDRGMLLLICTCFVHIVLLLCAVASILIFVLLPTLWWVGAITAIVGLADFVMIIPLRRAYSRERKQRKEKGQIRVKYEVVPCEGNDELFAEFELRYRIFEKLQKNQTLTVLEYQRLSFGQKFIYKTKMFFRGIPGWFKAKFTKLGLKIKDFGVSVWENIKDIGTTFKNGSWKTRVSYLIMGFGNFTHGQWLRGILFLLFEVAFIGYMAVWGGSWLGKFGTLGTVATIEEYDPILDVYTTVHVDNSFKILLYGLITIFFMIAFIYTWRLNVKQCRILDEITASGKKIKTSKEDIQSLADDEFHKTLLSLPVFGIVMFTILPIIFMILVGFTSYDYEADGYNNLFTWVGLENFNQMFTFGSKLSLAFGEILAWTLIWAVFATFSNYFLGMFVAMMINKKGIKIKKFWRTILVMTIAIPQFISLLYVSNLFADNGIINATLMNWGWISQPISFWGNGTLAKIMVLVINIWVGIPYLMLITTGILMNIPQDLYESAQIDGANAFQQFCKITMPYMLFVTGPYLLTSFVSNINNFNVIYLLTQGGPANFAWGDVGGYIAGDTTILITWLFGITTGSEANYKMASVIGTMIFIVVSVLSLIVFTIMPSTRREEDFS